MKGIVFAALLALMLTTPAAWASPMMMEKVLQNGANTYNQHPLWLVGDERANLWVDDEPHYIIAHDSKIVKVGKGTVQDAYGIEPTIELYTTEQVVDEVLSSDSPARAVLVAIHEGKVRAKAHTWQARLKLRLAGFQQAAMSMLGW